MDHCLLNGNFSEQEVHCEEGFPLLPVALCYTQLDLAQVVAYLLRQRRKELDER